MKEIKLNWGQTPTQHQSSASKKRSPEKVSPIKCAFPLSKIEKENSQQSSGSMNSLEMQDEGLVTPKNITYTLDKNKSTEEAYLERSPLKGRGPMKKMISTDSMDSAAVEEMEEEEKVVTPKGANHHLDRKYS